VQSQAPPAAIVEIDEPGLFAKLNQHDPYRTIKIGFAKAGRLPQRLHPGSAAVSRCRRGEQARRRNRFLKGDIKRATAAVLDSLRQVGRITLLPEPPGELTAVWLERHAGLWVPMIARVTTTGEIRAQLVDLGDIPYTDLPSALVAGHGHLHKDFARGREQLVHVLTGTINPRAAGTNVGSAPRRSVGACPDRYPSNGGSARLEPRSQQLCGPRAARSASTSACHSENRRPASRFR
jgi:MID domain-containing protein